MSFFKGILNDLVQRRLWPVPLALIAAIVAVPVVLAKSPQTHPAASASPNAAPGAGTPVASIRVANATKEARLASRSRDPFTQQLLAKATGAVTGAAAAAGGSTGSTAVVAGGSTPGGGGVSAAGGLGASSGSSVGTSVSGGAGTGSAPSRPAPVAPSSVKQAPAHSGLTSTEAYHVALSTTNPAGGVEPIDPLVRLTPVPSEQQPLLVELGVLKGTNHVLFAVQPGAALHGPGSCIPGPVDCEIVSLAPGQTESVAPSGSGQAGTLFQITGVSVDRYATAADASKARADVSRAGAQLLASSSSSTLALFQYDPAVGAVVDLRNLTVGGN